MRLLAVSGIITGAVYRPLAESCPTVELAVATRHGEDAPAVHHVLQMALALLSTAAIDSWGLNPDALCTSLDGDRHVTLVACRSSDQVLSGAFGALLDAREALAVHHHAHLVELGRNTGRHEAYAAVMARGYGAGLVG
jgi:hypothetical protein